MFSAADYVGLWTSDSLYWRILFWPFPDGSVLLIWAQMAGRTLFYFSEWLDKSVYCIYLEFWLHPGLANMIRILRSLALQRRTIWVCRYKGSFYILQKTESCKKLYEKKKNIFISYVYCSPQCIANGLAQTCSLHLVATSDQHRCSNMKKQKKNWL